MRRMLHHLRGGEGRGGEGRRGEGRGGEGRGGEGRGGEERRGMCVTREHPLHSSVLTQFLMTTYSTYIYSCTVLHMYMVELKSAIGKIPLTKEAMAIGRRRVTH